jgi:hypothetical protein
MPRTPTGAKRPADVIGNAVHVMRIATGQMDEATPPKKAKNPCSYRKKKIAAPPRHRVR